MFLYYCITVLLSYSTFLFLLYYCIVYTVYMGNAAWIKMNEWMNELQGISLACYADEDKTPQNSGGVGIGEQVSPSPAN